MLDKPSSPQSLQIVMILPLIFKKSKLEREKEATTIGIHQDSEHIKGRDFLLKMAVCTHFSLLPKLKVAVPKSVSIR